MTLAATRIAEAGLGTPGSASATRALLLGSGELGKEVAIELNRLGVEVIAADRYANAPAMQVAHRAVVLDMRDPVALGALLARETPDLVIPEIEAIATEVLLAFEAAGNTVVPTARAANLTMNREGIRNLAARELGLETSPYRFASSETEYLAAVASIGTPCVVKPIMSSSGKGQSTVKTEAEALAAWHAAQAGSRGAGDRVIVEGFVEFDFEITLLTIRHVGGTSFCDPIGHRQVNGDYQESWQPQAMTPTALATSQQMAAQVTEALGGYGLFGVELFVAGETVIFSEVSPRPHDTGMVTLISQDLSEFALHARAILGLPIPNIRTLGPAASAVILGHGDSNQMRYQVGNALLEPDTGLRLFGKPEVRGERRLGVALALAESTEVAREKAAAVAAQVQVEM
ncbi:MAG: formate-dependent phosphoribosylglycinamide formyltransferase [Pseudomonadales bacterium]